MDVIKTDWRKIDWENCSDGWLCETQSALSASKGCRPSHCAAMLCATLTGGPVIDVLAPD